MAVRAADDQSASSATTDSRTGLRRVYSVGLIPYAALPRFHTLKGEAVPMFIKKLTAILLIAMAACFASCSQNNNDIPENAFTYYPVDIKSRK